MNRSAKPKFGIFCNYRLQPQVLKLTQIKEKRKNLMARESATKNSQANKRREERTRGKKELRKQLPRVSLSTRLLDSVPSRLVSSIQSLHGISLFSSSLLRFFETLTLDSTPLASHEQYQNPLLLHQLPKRRSCPPGPGVGVRVRAVEWNL